MSRRIERVIVDECIGPATTAVAELRRQSGVARAEFVFLAVEHPGIPDAEGDVAAAPICGHHRGPRR